MPSTRYTNVVLKNTFLVVLDDNEDGWCPSSAPRSQSCPPVMCRTMIGTPDEVHSGNEEPRFYSCEALMPEHLSMENSPTNSPANQDEWAHWEKPYADHDGEITTQMIRNIPCRCTKETILEDINNMGFEGTYDFFYLPNDRRRKSNLGYAFINFKTAEAAAYFQQMLSGFKFSTNSRISNSHKVCSVSPAAIQGLENNIIHFRQKAKADQSTWTEDGTIPGCLDDPMNNLTISIDDGAYPHLTGTRLRV
eukprot:gnl/MRDRNA2_/MRDRNA2_154446_c0_seq1.p1 gnl/MRDRNA2_/MRDRNA2_154446_c0~~gnl/MRDRNA2_/MRDRNA2_154446_c0_seq1.p1  ORF type:complete len:250 (+),score=32.42 gnl/MRDRNA2_/MRDRNA2_154446_c0_seq1:89-838(+)